MTDPRDTGAELAAIEATARDAFESAPDTGALEEARQRHLGRQSALTAVLRGLSSLPGDERGAVGAAANAVRQALEAAFAGRRDALVQTELDVRLATERVDVTLPGRVVAPLGQVHPLTVVRRRVEDFFVARGYRVVEGTELETAEYVFDRLNTPVGHPARSWSDTFYLDAAERGMLRTETSPMQVRALDAAREEGSFPIYMVSPGRVYRRDAIDATHLPMFHQVEGMAVDEHITLADLKGTLQAFARHLFGPDREIRLRTGFFPFTEPSVEVDVSDGRGGWLEILGSGLIDPHVLELAGYDPERVSGFAFGAGLERLAMLMWGFPTLRPLVDGDQRVLAQFGRSA